MNEAPIEYASVAAGPMLARDAFGVVVRTIGLLLVLWGCYSVMYAIGCPPRSA